MPAEPAEAAQLRSILLNLGREICLPLDALRLGISRLLDDPDRPISESERAQAQTMLTLCDDLGRLTRERLGNPASGADRAEGDLA